MDDILSAAFMAAGAIVFLLGFAYRFLWRPRDPIAEAERRVGAKIAEKRRMFREEKIVQEAREGVEEVADGLDAVREAETPEERVDAAAALIRRKP